MGVFDLLSSEYRNSQKSQACIRRMLPPPTQWSSAAGLGAKTRRKVKAEKRPCSAASTPRRSDREINICSEKLVNRITLPSFCQTHI